MTGRKIDFAKKHEALWYRTREEELSSKLTIQGTSSTGTSVSGTKTEAIVKASKGKGLCIGYNKGTCKLKNGHTIKTKSGTNFTVGHACGNCGAQEHAMLTCPKPVIGY